MNAGTGSWASYKYKLINDIDYEGAYHLPIGHVGSWFTGVMDGNNKVISRAKFGMSGSSSETCTGFIVAAYIGSIISNLTIDKSCVINSSASYVSSIAGYYGKSGDIYNSVNKADIYAYDSSRVGGVVAFSYGTVSNVYNTGNIYVDSSASYLYVGGVVGRHIAPLYLKNAYNTGNITYKGSSANPYIGGVIGDIYGTLYIANVYNSGTVTSSGETKYTGSVFGYAYSSEIFKAANVYFTGNASLPATGFGSASPRLSDASVVGWVSGFTTTHVNNFNSVAGMSGVWANGPNNRPIIAVLPAE